MTSPTIPSPPPPRASPPALLPRASVTWPVSSFAPGRNRISDQYPLLRISMHGLRPERRDADRHVLRALRRRVPDALARPRQDGLAGAHRGRAAVVLDDDRALEHQRDLVELRRLRGLLPAWWARHSGDAQLARAGARPADELADDLLADSGDDGGKGDVDRHGRVTVHARRVEPAGRVCRRRPIRLAGDLDLAANLAGRVLRRVHVDVGAVAFERGDRPLRDAHRPGLAVAARAAERNDHRAGDACLAAVDVRGDRLAGQVREGQLPLQGRTRLVLDVGACEDAART